MSLARCVVLRTSSNGNDIVTCPGVPGAAAKELPSAPVCRTADVLSRFDALCDVIQREYVPMASFSQASESAPCVIKVACDAERGIILQCAAELEVPVSMFDVVVDCSRRTSSSFWLTESALASALADPTGQVAARLAVYVIERSVLHGKVETWDLHALANFAGDVVQSAPTDGPCVEIRASVPMANLAEAEEVVRVVNAVMSHPRVLVSAVLGVDTDLVGTLPALSSGAPIHVDAHCPASHPQYPQQRNAFISSLASGVGAAAAAAALPAHAVHEVISDATAFPAEWVVNGRFTLGAYVVWNGSVYVVTAGHKLARFASNAYVDDSSNLLVLIEAVNPPACSSTKSFFVAKSSDAVPHSSRVSASAPRHAVDVVVRAHADVSIFLLNRPASPEELGMVSVPVHSRQQMLLVTPEVTGPQHPFLGLVAYEDSAGPLWFAGCTAPGTLRRLFKVGVAKKRVALSMGPDGDAMVTWIFTDVAVHDGKAESGPRPASGDSGGPVLRTALLAATGLVAELESFMCGCAESGSGAALRSYYVLTPAPLALAQLNALPAFAAGARLEFCQPRLLVAAVLVAGSVSGSSVMGY